MPSRQSTVRLLLPPWADSADTGGGAGGSASGSGNGSTSAANHNSSQSDATSTGHSAASGETISSTSSWVGQGNYTNNNRINISAQARARASSSKKKIEAYASAGVNAVAKSTEGSTSALSATFNGGEAYAANTEDGSSAYAGSTNGGYALAITGPQGSTTAYVPDGQSNTYSKGKKSTTIAYSATGSFSIAMTKGKHAWAATGTTENVGALAAGNVKSVIRSAMYASAMASPGMASAYARASVGAFAENSFGQAQANGHAYAYAVVKRTGNKVVLSVATSSGPHECNDQWWKKNTKKRECIVRHKVISLTAKSATKKKAFAVLKKSKKSIN